MENHHPILHIRISLGTKFQPQQAILIFFGTNLVLKNSFRSTQQKNEHRH